jgi:hypothetical protein
VGRFFLIAGLLALGAANSLAQAPDSRAETFAALRAEVQTLKLSAPAEKRAVFAEVTRDLTECDKGPLNIEGERTQYIYNDVYAWAILPTSGGFCVHLVQPMYRPLSLSEASDLLVASRMEFPVDAQVQPSADAIEPQMGRGFGKEVKLD